MAEGRRRGLTADDLEQTIVRLTAVMVRLEALSQVVENISARLQQKPQTPGFLARLFLGKHSSV